MSKINEMLKMMKAEDIPEIDNRIFVPALNKMLEEQMKHEKFYVGDGLDFYRFWIKNMGCISFTVPRQTILSKITRRYIASNPETNIKQLQAETGLTKRTIYNYMQNCKEEKISRQVTKQKSIMQNCTK